MALLRRDPKLIASVIEQFLRYESSLEIAATRYAAKDVRAERHNDSSIVPGLVCLPVCGA